MRRPDTAENITRNSLSKEYNIRTSQSVPANITRRRGIVGVRLRRPQTICHAYLENTTEKATTRSILRAAGLVLFDGLPSRFCCQSAATFEMLRHLPRWALPANFQHGAL